MKEKKYYLRSLKRTFYIGLGFIILIFIYMNHACVYDIIFSISYHTDELLVFNDSDFNLKSTHVPFAVEGNILNGYMYDDLDTNNKGLIVFSHGIGSDHKAYLDIINYFVESDYLVYAYDAKGYNNDKNVLGGLPEAVKDLDYAISNLKRNSLYKDYDMYLVGHSMGAYAVSNVLNYHSDIKGVLSLSGFNESSDMLESMAYRYAGPVIYTGLPIVRIHEAFKFGKYHFTSSISGFKNTDAKIIIVHSSDDKRVGIKYGYNKYYKEFKANDRFTFIKYESRGHGMVYYNDSAITYLNNALDKYDPLDKKEKEEYKNNVYDRDILLNALDKELFDRVLNIFNTL